MLERVEKVVLRHPVTSPVKLPWQLPSGRCVPAIKNAVASSTTRRRPERSASRPEGPIVEADADALVRDGSYANQNFATGDLVTQKDATGSNQESYLRFDLSGVTQTVTAAVLRLAPTTAGGAAENQLALVTNNAWSESGITWNNKPAPGATPVACCAAKRCASCWWRRRRRKSGRSTAC